MTSETLTCAGVLTLGCIAKSSISVFTCLLCSLVSCVHSSLVFTRLLCSLLRGDVDPVPFVGRWRTQVFTAQFQEHGRRFVLRAQAQPGSVPFGCATEVSRDVGRQALYDSRTSS